MHKDPGGYVVCDSQHTSCLEPAPGAPDHWQQSASMTVSLSWSINEGWEMLRVWNGGR